MMGGDYIDILSALCRRNFILFLIINKFLS